MNFFKLIFKNKKKSVKCQSCQRGFNGTNGNGYQPCGCGKSGK